MQMVSHVIVSRWLVHWYLTYQAYVYCIRPFSLGWSSRRAVAQTRLAVPKKVSGPVGIRLKKLPEARSISSDEAQLTRTMQCTSRLAEVWTNKWRGAPTLWLVNWYLLYNPPSVQVWHKAVFRWVRVQGQSPHIPSSPKNASGSVCIPLKIYIRKKGNSQFWWCGISYRFINRAYIYIYIYIFNWKNIFNCINLAVNYVVFINIIITISCLILPLFFTGWSDIGYNFIIGEDGRV